MQRRFPLRTGYSRAERRSDAAIHVAGVTTALVAAPGLVMLTAGVRGDPAAVTGAAIYGATLVAMLLCSALYQMNSDPAWRPVLRRLDLSAIYWKIAGTFTPFALLSAGSWWHLIGGLWSVALAGTGLLLLRERPRWLSATLFLVMGWAGALVGAPLLAALPGPVVLLVATGGAVYTLGVGFYLFDRLPFHNTIWHGCVLVATVALYAAVLLHVLDMPAHPPAAR